MGRASKPGEDTRDAAGDFLARWSRRKLEARREGPEPGDDRAAASRTPALPDAAAEPAPAERELTDADMPPLESLTADSDFTPFMSPGVSSGLRRLALRKLFNQPGFNVTDGLNDYDEDYTQFASLGNVITHEMKRMLRRELEGEQAEPTTAVEPAPDARSADDVAVPVDSPPLDAAAVKAGGVDADSDSHDTGQDDAGPEDKAT